MLSSDRLGKFTASTIHNLFVGGKGATRDSYIMDKAIEAVKGYAKSFSSKHTEHGNINELEALESFIEVTGLNAIYLDSVYYPINENCGSTPDAALIDFEGVMTASIDLKCPTEKFFEQKMMMINDSKPEFQNVPKAYFYQAQMQMMSLTKHNEALGYPAVTNHYLVRYLTSTNYDFDGNKIEIDLPLNVRIFYKIVKADLEVQAKILQEVAAASEQRDALINILKQPII
jgi:hypothetical protein